MAQPYQSPRNRALQQPASMAEDPVPAANPPESVSGFLPKDFFGENMPKTGDSCTVTVKAVDPESGEVEVTYASAPEKEPADTMEAMDQQLPPEKEE